MRLRETKKLRTGHHAGGAGVPPVHAFQVTRRNLPHMQEPGRVYFLTWKCQEGQHLSPEERTLVLQSLSYWEERKWSLIALVVMPDHVHALARVLPHPSGGVYNLAEMFHSIKSYSAHQIMKQRGKQGQLWQDERYDRIVRDEAEFLEKWNYIRNNSVKAGLAESPEAYPWLYEKGREK